MEGVGLQEKIEHDIRKVEQEIIKTEEQIEKVEAKIEKVEETLRREELPRHLTAEFLHEEKRQLREKNRQLREKNGQLREEERRLREKEIHFVQAPLQGSQDVLGLLRSELQGLKLEVHSLREALPSVLVGHVITASKASCDPQATSNVFDALGLSPLPLDDGSTFSLPSDLCAEAKWAFSWKWPVTSSIQERESYQPVLEFLRGLSFYCEDVSEGQHCVGKLLFNSDIYTRRQQNPTIAGQTVFLRNRVEGGSDIVVLNRDHQGHDILRNMVRFAVEIKTVDGYNRSSSGGMREAQLQLIGLNAFNTNGSPPVLLTNLAEIHKVVYLDVDHNWQYCIRVQSCDSFSAAVYFANQQGSKLAISQHFSRPTTPDTESDFRISV